MVDDGAGDLAAQISTALAPTLGAGVTVSDVYPLSSGASRQSWRFQAGSQGEAPRPYVLQREMVAGDASSGDRASSLSTTGQAGVLVAAARQGVPVPPVVATGTMAGRQFLVTGWLAGEALPPRLLRDPQLAAGRARLMDDCARALAGIHSISPATDLQLEERDSLARYRNAPRCPRRASAGPGVRLPLAGPTPTRS